jgi:uncharacterized protein YktA (UPF0223 family)
MAKKVVTGWTDARWKTSEMIQYLRFIESYELADRVYKTKKDALRYFSKARKIKITVEDI